MYRIINGKGSTCFEVAKQEVRKKIIKECNQHGWRLVGGASVDEEYIAGVSIPSYNIYQTVIKEE